MDDLVREGDILVGKYRVERVLGQGGMGIVVAAQHLQLEQPVALKFLLPGASEIPEAVGRFLREARAAARIRSEHVARVTDVGTLESGAPYMVMELLSGMDLAQVVRAAGPLSITTAVDYLLQACEGVAEAHKLGIVHRDLKPSNLFLTQRSDGSPLIKVLDFGISKAASSSAAGSVTLTATAAVMGSPMYMSPEQVRSAKDVDGRADVWALGVVLHELLTGAPVYHAESASALMAMIAADPPPPVRSLRPDVPVEIEAAILRCLQKDRVKRYANVGELALAIAAFASARGKASAEHTAKILQVATREATMTAGPALLGSSPDHVATGASWGNTAPRAQPHRAKALAVAAVGGAVVTVAVGVLVLLRGSGSTPAPSVEHAAASAPDLSATTVSPSPSKSPSPSISGEPSAPAAGGMVAAPVSGSLVPGAPATSDGGATPAPKKVVTAPAAGNSARPKSTNSDTARPKSTNSVFDNRTF